MLLSGVDACLNSDTQGHSNTHPTKQEAAEQETSNRKLSLAHNNAESVQFIRSYTVEIQLLACMCNHTHVHRSPTCIESFSTLNLHLWNWQNSIFASSFSLILLQLFSSQSYFLQQEVPITHWGLWPAWELKATVWGSCQKQDSQLSKDVQYLQGLTF